MTPKQNLDLHLTPKGQAVVNALANATPAGPQRHDMGHYVAIATCTCGAQFETQSEVHAFALLDDHIYEAEVHSGG